MFNGWSYPLTNIPAGWNSNGKWKLTYSSCQKLLGKDRIYEISDPTKTQRGDIIYTFDSSQAGCNGGKRLYTRILSIFKV